jgi:hypothetical protein
MKHVLFSLPYGLGFRNIVCCGILSGFVAKGGRATALLPPLPNRDEAALRAELPAGLDVRQLQPIRRSLPFTYLKALKQYQYSRRTALDAFQIKYQRRRQQTPWFHYAVTAAERAGESLIPESVVDALLRHWRQPFEDYYRRLLTELRPSAIALTKPGYHPDELPLAKAARAFGIPTMAIDTTWDNMASKRPPYILPERLTVWNNWMHGEAIDYYGFRPEGVVITSGTQFDVLFRKGELPGRAETLSSLGLDPARKLIVFSLNGPLYAPDNPGYIRLLLQAIASGAIAHRPNLVVRMHPFDRVSQYGDAVAGFSNVVLQRGFSLGSEGSAFECLPTHADVRRYGALMGHADLLLNQASTTSLDAMATDTPVINIAFDLKPTHPDMSIARVYGFTHYKRIVETGAVRLADTREELFSLINAYLGDRSLDADRRREAVDRFITFTDGRAAERITGFLWDHAA